MGKIRTTSSVADPEQIFPYFDLEYLLIRLMIRIILIRIRIQAKRIQYKEN